jgi:hypothetical protein
MSSVRSGLAQREIMNREPTRSKRKGVNEKREEQ